MLNNLIKLNIGFIILFSLIYSSQCKIVVVVVWKGIHSRSNTNRTGPESLSFYYPRLLYRQDQMLAVMLLSQHRVSSSKTVRPRAPYGARCMGHAVRSWSTICSEAPHSQFGEGTRPHLCMDEWNRPTPVRRHLSLSFLGQAYNNKPGTDPEYENTEPGCILTILCIPFMVCSLRSADAKSGNVV